MKPMINDDVIGHIGNYSVMPILSNVRFSRGVWIEDGGRSIHVFSAARDACTYVPIGSIGYRHSSGRFYVDFYVRDFVECENIQDILPLALSRIRDAVTLSPQFRERYLLSYGHIAQPLYAGMADCKIAIISAEMAGIVDMFARYIANQTPGQTDSITELPLVLPLIPVRTLVQCPCECPRDRVFWSRNTRGYDLIGRGLFGCVRLFNVAFDEELGLRSVVLETNPRIVQLARITFDPVIAAGFDASLFSPEIEHELSQGIEPVWHEHIRGLKKSNIVVKNWMCGMVSLNQIQTLMMHGNETELFSHDPDVVDKCIARVLGSGMIST